MLSIRRQRGAILIMTAVLIVVLIGVAALAMDIGRLVVLRSQLQNAADAAAIAAAMELNGESDARQRAMDAAREAVKHDKSFATLQDLLGPDSLPDSAFTFYCVIGAEFDFAQDVAISGGFCQGVAEGTVHVTAGGDPDAHYVRVNLDPDLASGRFTLDLIFLPILNLITPGTATEAAVRAQAVAGRHFIQCHFPPMVLCDPFEGIAGKTFKDDMPIGATITLREQGGNGAWEPGNFGFLQALAGPGANALGEQLANPDGAGCSTRRITTKPGQNMEQTTSAINTRFDMYDSHFKESPPTDNWKNWPPAPNIYEYHDVAAPVAVPGLASDKFSERDWDYDAWVVAQTEAYLSPPVGAPPMVGLITPLRWDVYNWEITNTRTLEPEDPDPAVPHTPGPGLSGPPSHVLPLCTTPPPPCPTPPCSRTCTLPERRLLTVAVIRCEALSINGSSDAVVNSPDGYAEIFVYKKAKPPSDATISGEYIRWLEPGDANTHVDVQLYE